MCVVCVVCVCGAGFQGGFLLNGVPTLLKGGCVHHDNGALGSATIDRAEERRVETLKKNGYSTPS